MRLWFHVRRFPMRWKRHKIGFTYDGSTAASVNARSLCTCDWHGPVRGDITKSVRGWRRVLALIVLDGVRHKARMLAGRS